MNEKPDQGQMEEIHKLLWNPERELLDAITQKQRRASQLQSLYDLLYVHKVWYWVEQNPSDGATELLFEMMASL